MMLSIWFAVIQRQAHRHALASKRRQLRADQQKNLFCLVLWLVAVLSDAREVEEPVDAIRVEPVQLHGAVGQRVEVMGLEGTGAGVSLGDGVTVVVGVGLGLLATLGEGHVTGGAGVEETVGLGALVDVRVVSTGDSGAGLGAGLALSEPALVLGEGKGASL